ncbi:SAM-dependent methyltransferase [Candidatus Marinamargulisbacteria bacterium SCGC AG-343-D04]|nr:SAM-dependent methyltransferase [Candidatus Marinamargulisbacteria bacterium SCGC AG-343-D04]
MGILKRRKCCLCYSKDLSLVLKLHETPPANEFVSKDNCHKEQKFYPLDLYQCNSCFHIQLCDVVDRALLFEKYVYVSGTSPVFVRHFEKYANDVSEMIALSSDDLVIDIGSNDGTLLSFFKNKGCRILGIDPAEEIAQKASSNGIETLSLFFNSKQAKYLLESRGKAKLITANNVYAHLNDFHDFTQGVKDLLSMNGVFVFEVSYFVDVFEKNLFDTIYHEHTSYHTILSLKPFLEQLDLQLFHVQRVDTHGGSVRCYVQHVGGPNKLSLSVQQCIDYEIQCGLASNKTLMQFGNRINGVKQQLVTLLSDLKSKNKRIAGFGAPAKATTLLYHFGIDENVIDYIVDDSSLKQGLFSPGMHIPIVSSTVLKDREQSPDYVIILAWNFSKPIIENHRYFLDNGGHFIVPLPKLEVVT